jgi:hypothetical protein
MATIQKFSISGFFPVPSFRNACAEPVEARHTNQRLDEEDQPEWRFSLGGFAGLLKNGTAVFK